MVSRMSSCPFVLGVDVGGTNTDAVLLREREVVAFSKCPTTPDPLHGIVDTITGCMNKCSEPPSSVTPKLSRVCIGTTHFVNAVVERDKDSLMPVAVIRLCGPASLAVPPFADFPDDLRPLLQGSVHMVSGGLEYNGAPISTFKREEIRQIAYELLSSSPPLKHVVVSGVFSPLDNPENNQEKMACDVLSEISEEFSITQASTMGRLGIIERENAAILNESLKSLANKTITAFQEALKSIQLDCPFYLTQNDGTLIDINEAMATPILTFSSGPTNSMRGAMFLSDRKDALVIDIGGTTTDIGVLSNGFPREANSQVKIGGVRTSFQMPNVVSIGLGGGSKVSVVNTKDSSNSSVVEVGPASVGYRLMKDSQCFGGNVLTATDIAVAAGITDVSSVKDIEASPSVMYKAMMNIRSKIETLIDSIKTDKKDIPVLLVGGGAILIDTSISLKGASCVILPPNYQVANAVGAALGAVSGRSERVESLLEVMESLKSQYPDKSEDDLRNLARDSVIQNGIDIATNLIKKKGAIAGSEVLHEKNVMAVSYVPDSLKVSVKMIGQLSDGMDNQNDRETNTTTTTYATSAVPSTSTDVPYWPFSTEEDKDKDLSAGLPLPTVNPNTGEWALSPSDIECITIGAGILGCGGGGDPNVGRIVALRLLEQGKEMKIINPWRINKDEFGLATAVAFMGAPVVLNEKLCSGTESELCLNTVQKILATGVCSESYDYGRKETDGVSLTTRDVSSGNKIWLPKDISELPSVELNSTDIPLDRRISGLICAEVGGVNSIEPLVTAAKVGLPILDADGMGRAFPELQMFLPFINGVRPYPSCVADEKGNIVAVTHASSPKDLEEIFRIECVRMGMCCACCIAPMSLEDVLSKCVLLPYSQAWQLGRATLRARALGDNSITEAIIEQRKGTLLMIGKINDVDRSAAEGFTTSTITIEGLGKFTGESIVIIAKNEYLIAHKINCDGVKEEVIAVTPGLITIIDSDTGYPITTEDVCYGLRVAVLSFPPHAGFTSPHALKVVGPKAFGFNVDVEYIS